MATVDLFPLGTRYRDTVSGWEGTLTAGYVYMNGCIRYEISGTDKDGKPESFVFDEQQIEPVSLPEIGTEQVGQARSGGVRSNRPVTR